MISHSHLGHLAGLVFLTETLAFHGRRRAGTAPVVEGLRSSALNHVLWPDFARVPDALSPVITYRTLKADAGQRVGDLWATPVAVSHTVPTVGFIIHDGSRGFVYSGDTGPTAALWRAVRGLSGLRAILLECAFPNRLADLADASGHMTPALIERELDKLPPDVPVWIFHVKPQFYEETAEELARLGTSRVQVLEQDKSYLL